VQLVVVKPRRFQQILSICDIFVKLCRDINGDS